LWSTISQVEFFLPLDRVSFDSTRQWINETRNLQGDDAKIVLVGSKIDLANRRQIQYDDGQKLAAELRVDFMETSSKTGENINELFVSIASNLPGLEGAEIITDQKSMFEYYS
jgi:GTPase SAR1 family protein